METGMSETENERNGGRPFEREFKEAASVFLASVPDQVEVLRRLRVTADEISSFLGAAGYPKSSPATIKRVLKEMRDARLYDESRVETLLKARKDGNAALLGRAFGLLGAAPTEKERPLERGPVRVAPPAKTSAWTPKTVHEPVRAS